MAYTENEIYYPYDYDASADVPEDMKTMAESIDEVIREIKGTQTTQNTRLSALETGQTSQSATIQALQAENSRLKKNQIYGTATGTEVEITDSAEMGANIDVCGESEQETRSGKNIFNPNNPNVINSATISFNNNIVTVSSTATNTQPHARWVFENLSVGDVFRINSVLLDSNCMIILQGYNGQDYLTIRTLSYSDGVSESSYSYTIPSGITSIRYLLYSSTTIPTGNTSARYKNVIITKNNSDLTYEPYGAMPSPEYPSEIKNLTGDTVCRARKKNMFDKSNVTLNKYVIASTGELGGLQTLFASDYIPIVPNNTYYWNDITDRTNEGAFYDENKNYISGISNRLFTAPENAQYVRLNGLTTEINNIQLEKGSTATPYEPYQEKSITFPFGAQKLCRKSNTEYDYLSDEGIVNVLEQTDNTGTKTIEESFSLRETPLVTPYTQAQQTAYDNLQNLILYEGYNYIEMISPNGVKANLTVDYTKSTKMVINDIEERLSVLEYAGLEG